MRRMTTLGLMVVVVGTAAVADGQVRVTRRSDRAAPTVRFSNGNYTAAPYRAIDWTVRETDAKRYTGWFVRVAFDPVGDASGRGLASYASLEKFGSGAVTETLTAARHAFENWGSGALTYAAGTVHEAFQFSTGTIWQMDGVYGAAYAQGTGAVHYLTGGNFLAEADPGAATGSVAEAYGSWSGVLQSIPGGLIQTAYGAYAEVQGLDGASSVAYGVYVGPVQANTKWSVFANDPAAPSNFKGNIKIGDASAPAKPTCNAQTRGFLWHTYGGAGVKDTVEVCAKDATDAYAWRPIY